MSAVRNQTQAADEAIGDPSAQTRQRLLEAAAQVFAEGGFRAATVREICKRAQANVAAIHYHFGDKDGLYVAVFREFASRAQTRYPITLAAAPTDPAPARLRSFVLALLFRMLDDGVHGCGGAILLREFVEPTHVLDEMARTVVRPMMDALRAIVRSLLEEAHPRRTLTGAEIDLHTFSIIGQVVFYKHSRPLLQRVSPDRVLQKDNLEPIAEHIAQFSLAAIRSGRSLDASPAHKSRSKRP